jgi:beta-aspartyl-peptidase (threonine type)
MWNAGDIDRFMDFYWKSDQLTFSSGGKVTRSWQSTLENYRQRYGARSLMGKLTFRNLEITPLGQTAAYVLGEWQLQRDAEILGGNFTLVFRYLDGRWLIVHDHTSRSEPS